MNKLIDSKWLRSLVLVLGAVGGASASMAGNVPLIYTFTTYYEDAAHSMPVGSRYYACELRGYILEGEMTPYSSSYQEGSCRYMP